MNETFEITTIESDIDNHNHTKGSDGKQSALRCLLRAHSKGKNIISFTDHDSVRGYYNLQEDLYSVLEAIKIDKSYNPQNILEVLKSLKLLTGTELITSYNGVIIEVLGYGIDIPIMEEEIKRLKTTVKERPYEVLYREFKKIINKNNLEFDKSVLDEAYNKIKKEGKGGVVGPFFTELSKYESNKKFLEYKEDGQIKQADTIKLFINKHLYNSKSELFVNMEDSRPKYKDTIEAIHKAGGKAIIAHPGRYMDKFDAVEHMDDMISYGLDGIEVYYPDHSNELRNKLLEKAREHNLIVSGGSDDHHSKKEGIQYETGRVAVPDIPETKWIKEETGEGYIQNSPILAKYINEIEELVKERKINVNER